MYDNFPQHLYQNRTPQISLVIRRRNVLDKRHLVNRSRFTNFT